MELRSKGKNQVLDWLLQENQPGVRYYTMLDLLDYSKNDSRATETYQQIPKRGWAHNIFNSQKPKGYWERANSLYKPKYTATNWRALVLSDFGLTKKDIRIRKIADLFFREWMQADRENIFNDEVCIVGNTARFMTSFGYSDDPRVAKLFERLLEDQKEDGGWHCFKSDTGTLDCWEALAAYVSLPKSKRSRRINRSIERGVEFYLERSLFNEGKAKYLPWFRFHYPVHYYYDMLVGLDVITKLGFAGDRRLEPALKILEERQNADGTWNLDAVHPDIGRGAGFGPLERAAHKRGARRFALEHEGKPSKWITLIAMRVLKRVRETS